MFMTKKIDDIDLIIQMMFDDLSYSMIITNLSSLNVIVVCLSLKKIKILN